jgi:subtilisin-like proprotein convertase family protein
MALKFLDANGSGFTSGAVRAIDYAISKGAHILNNSWGGSGFNQALSDAIDRARSADIVVVAAAGNGGSDGVGDNNDTRPHYPSSHTQDNVIAVAASDRNDNRASFSNYGPTSVDLYAPGVGIWSTTPNNGYSSYSGTSMATPHVSGALALLKARNPGWTYRQLIDAIRNTVDRVATLNNVAWGGRLNLASALAYGTSDSSGPTITGFVTNGPAPGQVNSIRLTFSEAINPATFTIADDLKLYAPSGASLAIKGLTVVTGSANTQFDVTFATQSTAGLYRLIVSPRIRDVAGNAMASYYNGTFTITNALTYRSGTVNLAIKDLRKTVSSIQIRQGHIIADLNVTVDVSHTWVGDLIFTLRAPNGTLIKLFDRRGGSGDNVAASFDDEASTRIRDGLAPFSGVFRPEVALSGLDGLRATGRWELWVEDRAVADTGKLVSWSLTLQPTVRSSVRTRISSSTVPSTRDGGKSLNPSSSAGVPWGIDSVIGSDHTFIPRRETKDIPHRATPAGSEVYVERIPSAVGHEFDTPGAWAVALSGASEEQGSPSTSQATDWSQAVDSYYRLFDEASCLV